jgi:single-strand DNA-binding protein
MSALYMTVVGVVGTEPRLSTWNGTPLVSFRMVASERRYDGTTQSWVDVHSSWVSVTCFRQIARNVAESVQKGDRVIVHGKVRVKEYVTEEGQRRTVVDIEGNSVGHDLKFGTTRFAPALSSENADDRLREQAENLAREQAELPQESIRALLAQRAARGVDDDPEELDDLLPEEEDDLDDEGDRRTSVSGMASVG